MPADSIATRFLSTAKGCKDRARCLIQRKKRRNAGKPVTTDRDVHVPELNRQQVAKAFYTETLGFTVVRDTMEDEQRWVELAPSGAATTITLVTWFPQMSPGNLQGLVLDTDNIAQAYEELKARGVEILPIESDQW